MKQIFALILLLFVSVALKAQERYKEYYDDGKLKTAGYINKNTGERQGHWVTYRQDGTKFEEFDYKKWRKKKANTTSTTTKDAYILWKLTTTECYTEQCCNTAMNPIEKDNCHFMHEQPTKMEFQ